MKFPPLRLLTALLALPALLPALTLEELAEQRELWPAKVILTGTVKATVVRNGQPGGLMLLGAGRSLIVTAITAEGVTGRVGGDTVRVTADKTDLFEQVGRAHPETAGATPAAVAPAPAPVPAEAPRASVPSAVRSTAMQRLFGGKLVRYAGGGLQPMAAEELAGIKYYALYFSASWCGPCRQFTPGLVKAYRELKQAYPEFEVVFISSDRSAADMLGYMRDDKMTWPAVRYDRREQKMASYSGPGIPCLVLVDEKGNVLADSFRGDDYLGPQHVLAETQRILRQNKRG